MSRNAVTAVELLETFVYFTLFYNRFALKVMMMLKIPTSIQCTTKILLLFGQSSNTSLNLRSNKFCCFHTQQKMFVLYLFLATIVGQDSDGYFSLMFQNTPRYYKISMPLFSTVKPGEKHALVLSFHGGSASRKNQSQRISLNIVHSGLNAGVGQLSFIPTGACGSAISIGFKQVFRVVTPPQAT